MALPITSFYAALIALLFLALSWNVIRYRRSKKLPLGDEGDRGLLKRMRGQANCAEYAPMALILLALAEAQGTPALAVHVLGLMLLVGRVVHGWGFTASPPVMNARVFGMILTLSMIGLTAIGLLGHSLF